MVRLTTARLILREFTPEDLPLLVELDSDPEVMRFISDGRPSTREETEAYLARWHEVTRDGLGYFAVFQEDRFIGWFHFRPDRILADAIEVGYRLRREAWGYGYATEGARALVEDGFNRMGVLTVTGRTMKGNQASAHVLQKCGLHLVGEYREDRWPGEDKTALLFQRSMEPATHPGTEG